MIMAFSGELQFAATESRAMSWSVNMKRIIQCSEMLVLFTFEHSRTRIRKEEMLLRLRISV